MELNDNLNIIYKYMKSELNKRKEKKYYTSLNQKVFRNMKNKIERGEIIFESEYNELKGPDKQKLIDYLKAFKTIKMNKNIGFEL